MVAVLKAASVLDVLAILKAFKFVEAMGTIMLPRCSRVQKFQSCHRCQRFNVQGSKSLLRVVECIERLPHVHGFHSGQMFQSVLKGSNQSVPQVSKFSKAFRVINDTWFSKHSPHTVCDCSRPNHGIIQQPRHPPLAREMLVGIRQTRSNHPIPATMQKTNRDGPHEQE